MYKEKPKIKCQWCDGELVFSRKLLEMNCSNYNCITNVLKRRREFRKTTRGTHVS